MGKRATTLVNWLFADSMSERIARKDVHRKVSGFRDAVSRDFDVRRQQGFADKFDQAALDAAMRKTAETAFKPIDERKHARIKSELNDACKNSLTPRNIIAAAALGYGAYRVGKYAYNKVVPAAKKALLGVRAYMRSDARHRAIPVRQHWRRSWKRAAQESETAFGNLLRGGVSATANPAARAVRRAKRIVSRYTNPLRGASREA